MTGEIFLNEREERLARLNQVLLVLTLDYDKIVGHEQAEREIVDSYLEDRQLCLASGVKK